jgi:hypothetical protein
MDKSLQIGLWIGLQEFVDLSVLCFGQAEIHCGDDAFDPLRITSANDSCSDGGVMERPSDGDDSSSDFVTCADGL